MAVHSGPADWWTEGTNEGRTHIATKGTVQANLVFNLDASVLSSYSGTGTTWNDLSGNQINGSLINGVSYSNSNFGLLTFDGSNDYITIPNSLTIRPSTELTVECVIRPFSTPSSWSQLIGYGQADYTNGNYLLFLETATTTCRALARVNNTEYRCNTNFVAPLNVFTHIIFTMKTGDAIRSYFNGVANTLRDLPAGSFTYNGTSSNYQIGSPGGSWFPGNIPLMKLYNRALSANEVLQNFNAVRKRFNI